MFWRCLAASILTLLFDVCNSIQAVLGKPLDKSVTCSDWELRPLSERQILYAANDAHCCVRIWEALREQHGADAVQLAAAADHAPARATAAQPTSLEAVSRTAPLSVRQGEASVLAAMRQALPGKAWCVSTVKLQKGSI